MSKLVVVPRPGLHIERWAKRSEEGVPIPRRHSCGSRRTMLTTYTDGSKVIECEGCWTVIAEVKRR